VKLTLALLARYAEVEPESGLLNLTGGGLDVFGLKSLPAEFELACAMRFLFREVEADHPFRVTLVTLGPDLAPVGAQSDFEIVPRLGEYHIEGGLGTYTVAGALTLRVVSPGMHTINIAIDDATAGSIPFQVFRFEERQP
jgi:hypothetical protein